MFIVIIVVVGTKILFYFILFIFFMVFGTSSKESEGKTRRDHKRRPFGRLNNGRFSTTLPVVSSPEPENHVVRVTTVVPCTSVRERTGCWGGVRRNESDLPPIVEQKNVKKIKQIGGNSKSVELWV
jgi:hypothetical protein